MELKEIGDALRIENRTLRYIMEQGIVPGLSSVNKGRGSVRDMPPPVARLVGLAATLHELGFRGPAVRELLTAAKPQLRSKKDPLKLLIKQKGRPVTVHLSIPAASLYEKIK